MLSKSKFLYLFIKLSLNEMHGSLVENEDLGQLCERKPLVSSLARERLALMGGYQVWYKVFIFGLAIVILDGPI